MPVASTSCVTSGAIAATTSWRWASAHSASSSTAAPSAPRRTRVTGPASSSRCPTASTGRSSTSTSPRRAPMPRASPSCQGIPGRPTGWPTGSGRSPPRRGSRSLAGERCPWTTRSSGRRRSAPHQSSGNSSSPLLRAPTAGRAASPSTDWSTACGGAPSTRSTCRPRMPSRVAAWEPPARPRTASTSRRCLLEPSSTRGCSPHRNWPSSTRTSPTAGSRAPSLSSTPASRRTPSRPGRWPTPTG